MKKLLLPVRFTCLLALYLIPHFLQGQCTVVISPAADTLCVGDSTTLTATVPTGGSLFTVMGGTNNHRGNMFDITALNTVTITQFDGSPMATTNVEVWYRVGTHVGFQMSSAGWTLIGSASNVVPLGSPTPTPFPIPINITIPAGQTYGFYVTSSNVAVSLNYSNGTAVGNVFASDGNIQFKEGSGLEYPFGNGAAPFTPRIWNGRIHYTVPTVASYAWSTGATTSSILVAPSATTTYSVTATAGTTCTASATVSVGTAAVDLGPDTSYCQGTSIVLDAGTAGNTYLWSTGATTQTISGIPGLNWAQVTDALGCVERDSIILTQNAGLPVNLGPDTLICGQSTYMLDAGNPGNAYLWNTGNTSQTQVVSSPGGNFTVEVSDSIGCSGADTVTVLLGNPSIDLGPDTTLCNAASTILTVGSGWASVLWSNGSTNNFININATNTYHATVTDSVGCTTSDSIDVLATSNPIASFSATGDAGCIQASVANSSVNGGTYLWLWGDGNTSTGVNPAPHTYSAPYFGDITLIVNNDCGSDTLTLPFGCVGSADPQFASISVTPNPSDGRFELRMEGLQDQEIDVQVLNLQGQSLFQRRHVLTGAGFQTTLALGDAASGVYLLRILTPSGMFVKRILVE